MSTLDARRAKELADLFVEFLRTNSAPEGLFTDDVFLDLSLPRWRLQTAGRDNLVTLRRASHPALGTVPRHRVDVTGTGLVVEFEERWEDADGSWYCRELIRAEVRDGSMSEVSVYCTGDWSPEIQDAHRREVTLIRP
ncbi:hypothetical protein [Streptomyces triticiradicis]|uniref:Nuclear transport factor 2 family protein n=1 Tax=Streptomyces triticiradicis TaxID=2651189 RepID=A0A7J5DPI9_9ACTN|nr:hypothetical protein [Streptomyces triticiradicis]KAB1990704.1 hypothetical protein F8144_01895 [Streptomyces triticiradicis]